MAYVSLNMKIESQRGDHQPLFEGKERLRSSEIKERQRDDHQPLFESKERRRSSEIKERQRDDQTLFENKQRLLAWKLKKMAYISFSGKIKAIYYVNWYIKL